MKPAHRIDLDAREIYVTAQALVLAIEVLSRQRQANRPENNIADMKKLLDKIGAGDEMIAIVQKEGRIYLERLTGK